MGSSSFNSLLYSGGVHKAARLYMCGGRNGKSVYFHSICCEPKTALKNKVYLKKGTTIVLFRKSSNITNIPKKKLEI